MLLVNSPPTPYGAITDSPVGAPVALVHIGDQPGGRWFSSDPTVRSMTYPNTYSTTYVGPGSKSYFSTYFRVTLALLQDPGLSIGQAIADLVFIFSIYI